MPHRHSRFFTLRTDVRPIAHKAAKLAFAAQAVRQGLAAQRGIQLRHGGLVVRLQKIQTDAKRQTAQQKPADEGKLQHKSFPFFAVHHVAAQLHGPPGRQVGVFCQQVGNQIILVMPQNARHDNQGAQADLQPGKKGDIDKVHVGRAEGGKQAAERRAALPVFHHKAGAANLQRRNQKKLPAHGNHNADDQNGDHHAGHQAKRIGILVKKGFVSVGRVVAGPHIPVFKVFPAIYRTAKLNQCLAGNARNTKNAGDQANQKSLPVAPG